MNKSWEELLFGAIAVELGLATRDQVEQCVHEQEMLIDPKPIGDVMVRRGTLAPQAVDTVLTEQRKRRQGFTDGRLFGEIALDKGYVAPAQLAECIREVIRLGRNGARRSLGDVMLRKRYITPERFLEIIRTQSKELYCCRGCNAYFAFPGGIGRWSCETCSGSLVRVSTPGDIQSESPTPPASRTRLGKYEIQQELGRGGMAVVYKALDLSLGRVVALKVLKEADGNLALVKRLQNEAGIAAKLSHPNIIAIHEIGQLEGVHYLCMDFIDGLELNEYIARERLPLRTQMALFEKVVRAVGFAHENGVIHRDLKPPNILVDKIGRPVITDFGLAKVLDAGFSQTKDGSALGTPYYMAPEQVLGAVDRIDRRTDVYALGVILYEILAGRPPFTGGNVMEVYQAILKSQPARQRSMDPDLEAICLKAMEREPSMRYDGAAALADDLARWQAGERVTAARASTLRYALRRLKRHRRWAIAVLGVALVSTAVTVGAVRFSRQATLQRALGTADRLYAEQNFLEAQERYGGVLALDEANPHARERFRECEAKIAAAKFLKLQQEAWRFVQEGQFDRARFSYIQMIQLDPKNPECLAGLRECERRRIQARLEEAARLGHEKKYADAVKAYEQVLHEDSKNVAAIEGKKECEFESARQERLVQEAYAQALRKYGDAVRVFGSRAEDPEALRNAVHAAVEQSTRVLALDADHADTLMIRARVLTLVGQTEEALRDLDHVIRLRPSSSDASFERGKIGLYRLVATLLEGESPVTDPLLLQMNLLQQMVNAGRIRQLLSGCVADFENAVANAPTVDLRKLYTGYLYEVTERTIQAADLLGRWTVQAPQDLDGYLGRAIAFIIRGDLDVAVEELEEAHDLWPSYFLVSMLRASCLARLERFDEAIREFQVVYRHLGGSAGLSNMGWIHLAKGDTHRAKQVFEESLRLSPNSAFLRANLAAVNLVAGDYPEAIRNARACQKPGETGAGSYLILGTACAAIGDTEGAERALEPLLKASQRAPVFRAGLLITLKRYDEAEAALRTESGDVTAVLVRGQLAQARGKLEEARRDYEFVRRQSPRLRRVADLLRRRLDLEH